MAFLLLMVCQLSRAAKVAITYVTRKGFICKKSKQIKLYYLTGKVWKKLTLIGFLFKSLSIVVRLANTLLARLAGVQIPTGARDIPLSHNVRKGSEVSSWGKGGRNVKLATHPI